MRYRPHRGLLSDSVRETKEYDTIEEMKKDISCEYFGVEDIVVLEDFVYDERIGYSYSMVCIKRFGDQIYETPQCKGHIERVGVVKKDIYGRLI